MTEEELDNERRSSILRMWNASADLDDVIATWSEWEQRMKMWMGIDALIASLDTNPPKI